MNTCTVMLYNSNRKGVIRWPKKCSHNDTLIRVIKDALYIPIHVNIQIRALDKKVLDDNDNSMVDSSSSKMMNNDNINGFVRVGEMGSIVSLGITIIVLLLSSSSFCRGDLRR